MLRHLSQSSFLSGMLAAFALAGMATINDQPVLAQTGNPCHLFTSAQSIPDGFGAAYNLFSAAKEDLITATCDGSSANINVGSGAQNQYIYKHFYRWDGSAWSPREWRFGGTLVADTWYVGSANDILTSTGEIDYFVAYICQWSDNRWKCGCRDTACTQNYWQLQEFKQPAPLPEQPAAPPGEEGGAVAERDKFWAEKGYSLFWHATPSANAVSTDAQTWFKNNWTNGQSHFRWSYYGTDRGTIKMTRAPDGSPAVEAVILPNKHELIGIFGNQLGPKGLDKQTVWSMELYYPCNEGVTKTDAGGTYAGFGHIWGSVEGEFGFPGGSNNATLDRAWSVRVPIGGSLNYGLYAYIPDKNVPQGRWWGGEWNSTICDTWNLMELEIVQNTPASAKNAALRFYLNGELHINAADTQTRTNAGVLPKGWGIAIGNTYDNPKKTKLYYRNWKIYVK